MIIIACFITWALLLWLVIHPYVFLPCNLSECAAILIELALSIAFVLLMILYALPLLTYEFRPDLHPDAPKKVVEDPYAPSGSLGNKGGRSPEINEFINPMLT